jgi:hypothetical protein
MWSIFTTKLVYRFWTSFEEKTFSKFWTPPLVNMFTWSFKHSLTFSDKTEVNAFLTFFAIFCLSVLTILQSKYINKFLLNVFKQLLSSMMVLRFFVDWNNVDRHKDDFHQYHIMLNVKMSKHNVEKCRKMSKMSKMSKNVENVENVEKCRKMSKNVENVKKCRNYCLTYSTYLT